VRNRHDKLNLVGDILLSAGVVAYLGVFTAVYRAEAISEWSKLCAGFEIKCAENFRITDVLGVGTQIQQWVLEGLPDEAFAIENAIIMDNSSRWPLMIDPQMQGWNWIKGQHKDGLDIIKPTMDIGEV
jgi:dynein heavy chain, axonemal